jgi:hypothetical protein
MGFFSIKRSFQVFSGLLAFALLATANAAPPAPPAATPNIQYTDPGGFVADISYPQSDSISIFGTGLTLPTTTGYTFQTDVSLWVRWADGAPHKPDDNWHYCNNDSSHWCTITGWTRNEYVVTFSGLDRGVYLQFATSVGGSAWDYYTVNVRDIPSTVPSFTASSYTVPCVATSVASTDSSRLLTFGASSLDSSADNFYVNGFGFDSHFGRLVAYDGWGMVWLPASVQSNCGSQQWIWIGNHVGWSVPALLTVHP